MKYQQPTFTVPASSAKSPENCKHGWIDAKRQRCVLCGQPSTWTTYSFTPKVFTTSTGALCSDFSKPEDWGQ